MRASQSPGKRWFGNDGGIAAGLSGVFFLLYLRTLCPTVYLGDSGEISTAIASGGIVHPPGYPLFSLLGRMALVLIPFGEPAFRIGCLVALAAAAAVGVLYSLARELRCAPWAAATAAGVFGLGGTYWGHATLVEVYSLHVLIAGLALVSALRYRRRGRLSDLAAAVLAGSLGLAHHLTIVLLVPALLILCGGRLWRDPGIERRLAVVAGALPVGPALYLLLMVWARAEPQHAWGDPVTLPLLWNHMSARAYQGLLRIPDAAQIAQGLKGAGVLFLADFPLGIGLLSVLGGAILFQRDRAAAWGLLAALLAIVTYNLCYAIDDIAGYYLAAWLPAAALLAVALDALSVGQAVQPARIRGRAGCPACPTGLGCFVALGILGALAARNWGVCDLSRTVWVREFARHKLESVDDGGVLITSADIDTFPIWYVQDALGVRRDVATLDRSIIRGSWICVYFGLDPSQWYLRHLRRKGLPASIPPVSDRRELARLANDGYLLRLLEHELAGRPLCTTFGEPGPSDDQDPWNFLRWGKSRRVLSPQGLVLRLQPKDRPVSPVDRIGQNARIWAEIDLPDQQELRRHHQPDLDMVAEHYACMLVHYGDFCRSAGRLEQAEAIYRRTLEWAPHYRYATTSLAALRQAPR